MMRFLLLIMLACARIHSVVAFAAPNSRVEVAAIKRFREFEKLCKTCPTTLKPRVETLTEMIVGLTDNEREELWSNVASRLEQEQGAGAKTPEDVYKFQTGADAVTIKEKRQETVLMNESPPRDAPARKEVEDTETVEPTKLLRKMSKTRSKLQEAKAKRARIQRLLHQTDSLLSNNKVAPLNGCDETDSTMYHCIDELEQMNSTELKHQRLKYMAQKSKLDQKIAKYRLKLYGVSLELAKQVEEIKESEVLVSS